MTMVSEKKTEAVNAYLIKNSREKERGGGRENRKQQQQQQQQQTG